MKKLGFTLLMVFGLTFVINAQYPPAKLKALEKQPRSKSVTQNESLKVNSKAPVFKIKDGGTITLRSDLKPIETSKGNKRKARLFPKMAERRDVHHLSSK